MPPEADSRSPAAGAFVALLRGINVSGKNMLPMKDLVAIFERAGCADVAHYIQSGNVVFKARASLAPRLSALVGTEIERRFGLRVPVVIRTGKEMQAIARDNPFLASGADPESLHVMFLADKPGKKESSLLDPDRSPPDSFVLRGCEIYLSCPNGMARTKLTNSYFDSKLGTTSTCRNWRTVLKLVEMSGAAAYVNSKRSNA
jgi:uncharacterized protein (DUF1697 family)